MKLAYRLRLMRPFWATLSGVWFWADFRDHVVCLFALRGCYEAHIRDAIRAHLPPDGVFVDVGANLGFQSVPASRAASLVISIEASPSIARLLSEGASRNGRSNILVVNKACSSEKGKVSLFISATNNQGMNSLSSVNANSKTCVEVEADTLDNILSEIGVKRVDVIKIDTEGAELCVLRGMEETIAKFHPAVIIELEEDLLTAFGTTVEEICAFLISRGYSRQPVDSFNSLFVYEAK